MLSYSIINIIISYLDIGDYINGINHKKIKCKINDIPKKKLKIVKSTMYKLIPLDMIKNNDYCRYSLIIQANNNRYNNDKLIIFNPDTVNEFIFFHRLITNPYKYFIFIIEYLCELVILIDSMVSSNVFDLKKTLLLNKVISFFKKGFSSNYQWISLYNKYPDLLVYKYLTRNRHIRTYQPSMLSVKDILLEI